MSKNENYKEKDIFSLTSSSVLIKINDEFKEIIIYWRSKVAKHLTKDELFTDFFQVASESFLLLESEFGVEVFTQVFGVPETDIHTPTGAESAAQHVKELPAWKVLDELYDYAVDGIISQGSCMDESERATELVLGGAEILSLITTENNGPSKKWDLIIALGDGRFALDTGEDIELNKLSLLAGVDHRTVRNAISANELMANKVSGINYISHKSAVKWLGSRRGYTPTRFVGGTEKGLPNISSATELGAFLLERRSSLNIENPETVNSAFTIESLSEIESGVFTMPLDAVFHIADFYQIDRSDFLDAVMRIYFSEQLKNIVERNR